MPGSEVAVVIVPNIENAVTYFCSTFPCQARVAGQALFGAVSKEPMAIAALVVEIVCTLALAAALILSKTSLWRTVFACAMEICAWRICKTVLGSDSIITTIMTWLTAGVLIILTLVIVNNIHWRQPDVRADQSKPTEPSQTDNANDTDDPT